MVPRAAKKLKWKSQYCGKGSYTSYGSHINDILEYVGR